MKRIRTHYDNLKVARNAPPEVIRAAYKALSLRVHPDRNPGNADAVRIMAIINTSYEVLADPDKRHAHDLWVARQELAAEPKEHATSRPQPPPQARPTRRRPTPPIGIARVGSHVGRNWLYYGFAISFVLALLTTRSTTPPAGPKPYQNTPPPEPPRVERLEYVRPATAPNGKVWPLVPAYVGGYQRLHADGLSTVTVDNSQNDSDVFVKLVSLAGAQAYPVRQFYIPAYGRFTVQKVRAGSYDVRYRDLHSGGLSRSEAFSLEEVPTATGTQFSDLTMTLYKVQNGNMETYRLSESEFEQTAPTGGRGGQR